MIIVVDKYVRLKGSSLNQVWESFEVNGNWYLPIEAKQDLDDAGIPYTIDNITIITQPEQHEDNQQ